MKARFQAAIGVLTLCTAYSLGQVHTFVDDFAGWEAATGAFLTIDFETLPDGSPSVAGTLLTDVFNYTSQGATFSTPFDDPLIGGNLISKFSLISLGGTIPNPSHIRADLVEEAFSIGFFFGGDATFEVFDADGHSIVSESFLSSEPNAFLGVVSGVPISFVIMDEGTAVGIQSFHFAPVPEPGTMGLLALGGLAMMHRKRKRV
jgi:hypothetical protein